MRKLTQSFVLLLMCLLAAAALAQAATKGKAAKGKAAPAEVPAESTAEAEPDPVADAWRAFQAKRKLVHPAHADDAEQRSLARLNQLPAAVPDVPPAPAAPAAANAPGNASANPSNSTLHTRGGWLGIGAGRFAYVRRSPGQLQRVGVVVLLDEQARVPGELNVFADVIHELTLNGWDVWSSALPQVGTRAYPARTRKRYVPPAPDANAEPAPEPEAPPADAQAATKPPAKPQLIRRRWVTAAPRAATPSVPAVPVSPTQPPAAPAAPAWPNWQSWRVASQGRLAALMTAVQAELGGATVPIVVVGQGLGADLVAEQGQQQGVAALVLLDLVRPPEGLALELDRAVAGLQAPTLVLSWRQPDPVVEAAWLRTADETRVDMRGAPTRQVARRLRGWLKRELVDVATVQRR